VGEYIREFNELFKTFQKKHNLEDYNTENDITVFANEGLSIDFETGSFKITEDATQAIYFNDTPLNQTIIYGIRIWIA